MCFGATPELRLQQHVPAGIAVCTTIRGKMPSTEKNVAFDDFTSTGFIRQLNEEGESAFGFPCPAAEGILECLNRVCMYISLGLQDSNPTRQMYVNR